MNLDVLRAFPSRLLLAVQSVGEEELHRPEADGKWSVANVVAHLGDLELIYAVRIRTIVAHGDAVPLIALDQARWVETVHAHREPVADLLEEFAFHRRMNVAFIERLTAAERARVGTHPQYGPITVVDAAGRLERHDAKHLAQIERIKSAVSVAASI